MAGMIHVSPQARFFDGFDVLLVTVPDAAADGLIKR